MQINGIPVLLHDGYLEWCRIDLSRDWDYLVAVGNERNNQKRGYASTRQLTENPHFDGICGEWAYGKLYGLTPNTDLLVNGHPNPDFADVEIKTSTYANSPWLRMFVHDILRAKSYVLVALNKPDQSARVMGWASREDITAATVETIPGMGQRKVLRPHELRKLKVA